MSYRDITITVYRKVARLDRMCDIGRMHTGQIVSAKRLGPAVGTRLYNNGYEKRQTDLRRDAQGRTYHQQVGIDYSGNVSYARDEDGAVFWPSLGYSEFTVLMQDYIPRVDDKITPEQFYIRH